MTFHPKNLNFKHAVAMTNSVIKNLKKKNQLDIFKEEIEKKIRLGTMEKVSKEELGEIFNKTHHLCYVSMAQSENSESSHARMINNTKTSVSTVGTSFCLENKIPVSKITMILR